MSFSEEKIRQITREEIRRILDAGLMYTEESKNAPQTKPAFTPETTEYCIIEGNTAKPKAFIHDKAVWNRINEELKAQGYKWISEGKESRWQK